MKQTDIISPTTTPYPDGGLLPLVLVRMSAIGDTLIAARTQLQARSKGYSPFLLTQAGNESLLHCMPQLAGACLITESGMEFRLRDVETFQLRAAERPEFLQHLQEMRKAFEKTSGVKIPKLFLADLQGTGRSRKASAELEKILLSADLKLQKMTVQKLSFWRLILVIWGFLALRQWRGRTPPQWLTRKLKPVYLLQRDLMERLPAAVRNPPRHPRDGVLNARSPAEIEGQVGAIEAPYVVLMLGTSYRLKSWPREYFRRLIELLIERSECKIVLCGGTDDRNTGSFLAHIGGGRVLDMTGKTSLDTTLSLIRAAAYVVTGDSFASHAADLLKTPVSVIFGATHPLLGFAPEGIHATVHHAALSCSPCSRHGQGDCRFKNLRCLTSISAEEVFQKMAQVLDNVRQRHDAGSPAD